MTTPYGSNRTSGERDATQPPARAELEGVCPTRPTHLIPGRRNSEAPFDLPAGNYHLRVATRYLGDFGPAELPVAVYPGQQTTVYYRPPASWGMKGGIGFAPQPTRGMAVSIAIQVVAAVFLIVVIVAMFTL